jgi:Importin-beta N-terminal domain
MKFCLLAVTNCGLGNFFLTSEQEMASQELIYVLSMAASHVEADRKPAEAKLLEMEKMPQYWAQLQLTYFDLSLDQKVRSLAIICLKNGVTKYWRKTATNAVPEQEKILLRFPTFNQGLTSCNDFQKRTSHWLRSRL